jgi:hypothetical protein
MTPPAPPSSPPIVDRKAPTAASPSPPPPPSWSISVKTVGGGFDDCTAGSTTSSRGERLFNVTVSPEDGVSSLCHKIEGATGVTVSQQRLIYRGRIINDHQHHPGSATSTSAKPDTENAREGHGIRKIKDIAGLCDGQTIHLVRKRDTQGSNSNSSSNVDESGLGTETNLSSTGGLLVGSAATSRNSGTTGRNSLETDLLGGPSGSSGGGGGGALLAALLGLGSDDMRTTSSSSNNNNNNGTTASSSPPSSTWRTNRSRSHRRPHYRLSAEDLDVPNPGSMESVRQGLMTLHTLLPHSELYSEDGTSPLEANREWFRGQWIDVRDTVNQWLEATVVEVLRPEDILPNVNPMTGASSSLSSVPPSYPSTRRRPANVDDDPAISADDLEGRRRLLLEPCDPGDPEELSGDLIGFRPRSSNTGVQLLLIHYNGWPHRWDEWM